MADSSSFREKLYSVWLKLKSSPKVRQFFAAGAVSHGALVIGTTIGWYPQALNSLNEDPELAPLDSRKVSLMLTLVQVGALVGLIPSAYSAYKWGRIWTTRFLSLFTLLGWILIAFGASSVDLILAGRFITGFATGGFSIVVPLYLVETVQPKWRGAVGFMYAQQIYGGILLVFMASRSCDNWLPLTFNCAPIPIICFIMSLFIPESPTYYLRQGHVVQAENAMKWFHASDNVDSELRDLQSFVGDGGVQGTTTMNLGAILAPPYRKYFWVTLLTMSAQHLCGIGPFHFYTFWINVIAGGDGDNDGGGGAKLQPFTVAIAFTIVVVIAMGIFSLVANTKSRKVLFVVSCCLSGGCFGVLGTLYFVEDQIQLYWVKVGIFGVLVFVYAIGLFPIPSILMVETSHSRFPEVSVLLITLVQWATILAMTCALTLGDIHNFMGLGPLLWISASVCFIAGFVSYRHVPETTGKTLKEVQLGTKLALEDADGNGTASDTSIIGETTTSSIFPA